MHQILYPISIQCNTNHHLIYIANSYMLTSSLSYINSYHSSIKMKNSFFSRTTLICLMNYREIADKIDRNIIDDDMRELLKNKDMIKQLIDIDAGYLRSATDDIKDDYDTVMYAVKNDGYTLMNASDRLRDNRDIVLEAVKSNGLALQFASERLRDDFDIVLMAVQEYDVYRFASYRLKHDKQIILRALSHGDNIIDELPIGIRFDTQFMNSIAK